MQSRRRWKFPFVFYALMPYMILARLPQVAYGYDTGYLPTLSLDKYTLLVSPVGVYRALAGTMNLVWLLCII